MRKMAIIVLAVMKRQRAVSPTREWDVHAFTLTGWQVTVGLNLPVWWQELMLISILCTGTHSKDPKRNRPAAEPCGEVKCDAVLPSLQFNWLRTQRLLQWQYRSVRGLKWPRAASLDLSIWASLRNERGVRTLWSYACWRVLLLYLFT